MGRKRIVELVDYLLSVSRKEIRSQKKYEQTVKSAVYFKQAKNHQLQFQ